MMLNLKNIEDRRNMNMLNKCSGIVLIEKYLPHISAIKECYVVDSVDEWRQIEDTFPDIVTVRTDSKIGTNIPPIGGQTFERERVAGYIEEAKLKVSDCKVLCIEMEEDSAERIHTGGGVVIDAVIGNYIHIDHVGPGFDGRELTKGKACHEAWSIPWDEVLFFEEGNAGKYRNHIISQDAYIETAKERMKFLLETFPDKKDEIFAAMPKRYNGINRLLLRNVISQVVYPLYLRQKDLLKDKLYQFGVQLNVRGSDRLIPFEISRPERFKVYQEEKDDRLH